MYFYFYDGFLNNKKYRGELNRIESRLFDLGINGRSERMSILKNAKDVIEDGIKQGATTIVAIGNDATFRTLIHYSADHDVTIGFIPLEPSRFATIFGIPLGHLACDILSRRITKKIDIGKIQSTIFAASLEIPSGSVKILCDGRYTVSPTNEKSRVSILNIGRIFDPSPPVPIDIQNPCDGKLEAVILEPPSHSFFSRLKPSPLNKSVFSAKHFVVKGENVKVVVDHEWILKTPVTISVLPKKLSFIVGKQRMI